MLDFQSCVGLLFGIIMLREVEKQCIPLLGRKAVYELGQELVQCYNEVSDKSTPDTTEGEHLMFVPNPKVNIEGYPECLGGRKAF